MVKVTKKKRKTGQCCFRGMSRQEGAGGYLNFVQLDFVFTGCHDGVISSFLTRRVRSVAVIIFVKKKNFFFGGEGLRRRYPQ